MQASSLQAYVSCCWIALKLIFLLRPWQEFQLSSIAISVSLHQSVSICPHSANISHQELSNSWDGRPFGHNRNMGRKAGASVPFPFGPHLTQCRLGWGLPSYHVASWSIQPFATKDMGRKVGAAVPLSGRLGPHLTQCGLGRGLPPYQMASWSIQPFGQIHQRRIQTDSSDGTN